MTILMKNLVRQIKAWELAKKLLSPIVGRTIFPGSVAYWEERYRTGGNSGRGSYGRLANWKAEIVNDFVAKAGVQRIIEHGAGDGNQLSLAHYPEYLGLDISPTAIDLCRHRFRDDPTKKFLHISEYFGETYELALSMDVIFHLVEDAIYIDYMSRLFKSASHWVIIYSSNRDSVTNTAHVRHRDFVAHVAKCESVWQLVKVIPNQFPYEERHPDDTSFSDFYFFKKPRDGEEGSLYPPNDKMVRGITDQTNAESGYSLIIPSPGES